MFKRNVSLLLLAVGAVGCGGARSTDYGSLGLVDVAGVVTLDGMPAPNLRVVFEADDKTYSTGVTDEKGAYRLKFNSERAGCKPGHKTVRIQSGGGESESGDEKPLPPGPAVPEKYNRKSELTADVSAEKKSFDFALMGK